MNLKTNLAHKSNYGSARDTSKIKYIVVHYTGNDGDHDESNGNYFKTPNRGASAHYFVDSDSITRSVPDNYVAWHCGTRGLYKHAVCRNTNSIGIELCDDVRDGKLYPSEKTINNALELISDLMKKYSIPKANVIRHWDVTGKLCPYYWCGTAERNAKWKTDFWDKIGKPIVVNSTTSNSNTDGSFLVRINTDVLNVRNGAGTSYKVNTAVKRGGVYTIVEEKNGWGKLKSGAGWIKLSYTVRVK